VYTLEGVSSELATHFKYLGSWIAEDAGYEGNTRTRMGRAKWHSGKIKSL